MKKRTSVFCQVVIVVVAVLGVVLVFLRSGWYMSPRDRVANTKAALVFARADIEKYRGSFGSPPPTLAEAVLAIHGPRDDAPSGKLWREYLSDAQGNSSEHQVLNGQGGWYYNQATGELRVNLTDPVRHYLSGHLGDWADQVPTSW
jgi:type II secretory pathway pseudopilin PulG